MTEPDRTQDIIDAIDGAGLPPVDPERAPEAMRQLCAGLARVTRPLGEAFEAWARALNESWPKIDRALLDVGMPTPLPADPRDRALQLRRTRNTGPERKPAGAQKRPRKL